MPLCSYRCDSCRALHEEFVHVATPIGQALKDCPVCTTGTLVRAIVSVNSNGTHPRTRFVPHVNNATGRPTSSMSQFRDDLKRKSEEASVTTGIFHDYQPVDVTEREACGATAEGDYEGAKRQRQFHGGT